MGTPPRGDRAPPPAEAQFLSGAPGKRQGFADWRRAPQAGRGGPPFDGRGGGPLAAQRLAGLVAAFLPARHLANFNFWQAWPLAVFAHLPMGGGAWQPQPSRGRRVIRLAKNLWEQAGLAGLASRAQSACMAGHQPGDPRQEEAPEQPCSPCAVAGRDAQFPQRVAHLRFPGGVGCLSGKAILRVAFQGRARQGVGLRVMKRLARVAAASGEAAERPRGAPPQAGGALEPGAFPPGCGAGPRFRFGNFAMPPGGGLPFATRFPAWPPAQGAQAGRLAVFLPQA